jgi:hypothetical protein
MSQQILLTEDLTPDQANLIESIDDGKNYYLSGIMMQAGVINGNGREYQLAEMLKVVEENSKKIASGQLIMGELTHPNNIAINLANVSHAITEMRMDGSNVVGKMKLLNTPSGQIAKAILEGGVRLGVSSRGTGSVGADGKVSGFSFVTVDIVDNPSAPDARPNLVRESLENQKIVTLAEIVVEDKSAQKHLEKEIKKFLLSIVTKK